MKKLFFLLTVSLLVSTLSVSAKASPPLTDCGRGESIIKQSVSVPSPVVTLADHEVYFMPVAISESTFCETQAKPQPMVQSVCMTDAPYLGVDGRAVLSWCIKDYNFHRILDLGFHYSEGRATEYRC